MPRPISVTIHMEALRHNLARMREAAHGRDVWAVVKANAYGHGLNNAVAAFADADGLATIDICDAVRARGCGWKSGFFCLKAFLKKTTSRIWKSTRLKQSFTHSG